MICPTTASEVTTYGCTKEYVTYVFYATLYYRLLMPQPLTAKRGSMDENVRAGP